MPGPLTVTACFVESTRKVKRESQLKSLNGAMSCARMSFALRGVTRPTTHRPEQRWCAPIAARDSRLYELSAGAASAAAAVRTRARRCFTEPIVGRVLPDPPELLLGEFLGGFERFGRPLADGFVLAELARQRKAGDAVQAAADRERELADA